VGVPHDPIEQAKKPVQSFPPIWLDYKILLENFASAFLLVLKKQERRLWLVLWAKSWDYLGTAH
jgi:hypothetical protein